MTLTIAIPTYNRNRALAKNFSILLPQLNGNSVKVLIVDNASEIPVADAIFEQCESQKDRIKIHRNNQNIGLAGNFIKCVELCDTEYMWLLSDDDEPLPNAVQTILGTLNEGKYLFINFKSNMAAGRSQRFLTRGLSQCIQNIDSFYNLLFFSVGVYHVKNLLPGLRYAYLFAYSLAPHVALLLSCVKDDDIILFSEKELVIPNDVTSNLSERWSAVTLSLNIVTLAELNLTLNKEEYSLFCRLLMTHVKRPKFVFKSILRLNDVRENRALMIHIFEQTYLRSRRFRMSFIDSFDFILYRTILRNGYLLQLVIYFYNRINKKIEQFDRFNRL